MNDIYVSRREHELHRARNGAEFCELFRAHTQREVFDVIGALVPITQTAAIVLAGSIPLGTATPASDVDLIVFMQSEDFPALRSDPRSQLLSFASAQGALVAYELVQVVAGVELNLQIVALHRFEEICSTLTRAGVSLSPTDITILSRVFSGWYLQGSPGAAQQHVTAGCLLEIYCATRQYVCALKEIEDAQAALVDHNQPLASWLARMAVEEGFFSLLAAQGHTAAGLKWLRLLQSRRHGDSRLDQAITSGLPLLFPALPSDESAVRSYLGAAAAFLRQVRTLIEADLTFKIAFAVCPQIYPIERLNMEEGGAFG